MSNFLDIEDLGDFEERALSSQLGKKQKEYQRTHGISIILVTGVHLDSITGWVWKKVRPF